MTNNNYTHRLKSVQRAGVRRVRQLEQALELATGNVVEHGPSEHHRVGHRVEAYGQGKLLVAQSAHGHHGHIGGRRRHQLHVSRVAERRLREIVVVRAALHARVVGSHDDREGGGEDVFQQRPRIRQSEDGCTTYA